jgi:hypothetical protein
VGKFYEGLSEELSLYVKQIAWLNATPEKSDKSRRETLGENIELPPCDAIYLIKYLFDEIGQTMPSGMGPVPLTNTEIAAWQSNKGITLNSWEAKTMRQLSLEYVSQHQISLKADCIAPFGKTTKIIASNNMRESLRGLNQL